MTDIKPKANITTCTVVVHRVSKNVPPLTCYSLDIHNPITIIFRRSVTEKVKKIRRYFAFPPHLSSASALPCEIGNPEDSALVHCACNTVQLLQRSRRLPFSWTMSPNSPVGWTHWLHDLGSHTASSWVWVVRQKDWQNQTAGWIQAMHLIQHMNENAIFVFIRFTR